MSVILPFSFISFPQGKLIPQKKTEVMPRLGHYVHKQKEATVIDFVILINALTACQYTVMGFVLCKHVLSSFSLHFTNRNSQLVGPL